MTLGVKIQYWLLRGVCWTIGLLPTWFLYHVLLDVVYFIFYRVAGYRVKVVRENLRLSFPEKNERELKTIERNFYRHLAEVVIDTIDITSIGRKEIRKRIVFADIEEHEARMKGRNWIAALAHYGSWEYFSAYQLFTKSQVVGVYKPLHNKAFDHFYAYARSRFGLLPVPMHGILRYVASHYKDKEHNFALGLIADQTPSIEEIFYVFNFLNQPTPFFLGIEKIALKFKLPVYFMWLEKTSRIRYEARFEMIYDGEEEVADMVITERYVRKLEQMIRRDPSLWMWSHRRWKHIRGRNPENIKSRM